ncbi:MAG TPA: DUF6249 domain-containing protein [Nannocystaceae bacterium]|nr:DUF6249 domain-containing protein [Nannocystaceae bacterium]
MIALAGNVAHAAPCGGLVGEELLERSLDVVEIGIACVDQVSAFAGWIDLQTGGDPATCSTTRGFGFAFLALSALVVIALGRMRLMTEQKRLDLARRLVEQGLEPPTGLLTAPAKNDMRRGIVLVAAGLGLLVAGLVLGDRGLAAGGLVPAFIGAGYLVSFRLAMRGGPRT